MEKRIIIEDRGITWPESRTQQEKITNEVGELVCRATRPGPPRIEVLYAPPLPEMDSRHVPVFPLGYIV